MLHVLYHCGVDYRNKNIDSHRFIYKITKFNLPIRLLRTYSYLEYRMPILWFYENVI